MLPTPNPSVSMATVSTLGQHLQPLSELVPSKLTKIGTARVSTSAECLEALEEKRRKKEQEARDKEARKIERAQKKVEREESAKKKKEEREKRMELAKKKKEEKERLAREKREAATIKKRKNGTSKIPPQHLFFRVHY